MDEKLIFYNLENFDRNKIIENIKNIILENEKILIAIIFGSILKRNKIRDIDVAIYSIPNPNIEDLLALSDKIEEIVNIPIDVIPLIEIMPCLRYKIMTKGMRIIVKDERLFNEIMSAAFSECQEMKYLYTKENLLRKVKNK